MRRTTALLAALLVSAGAAAQRGDDGPFTDRDAQVMREVWPEIREAARYEDIDWRAHGVRRAPGDEYARSVLARNWSEVREARRFDDIDWDRVADARDRRASRDRSYGTGYGRNVGGSAYDSPFSAEDEEAMSRVWGRIREAAEFDDIDWRSVGMYGPPGGRDARRLMARYWGELRTAARFEDIDWPATTGWSSRSRR